MKKYMIPEIQIVGFDVEDIITASGGSVWGPGEGGEMPLAANEQGYDMTAE